MKDRLNQYNQYFNSFIGHYHSLFATCRTLVKVIDWMCHCLIWLTKHLIVWYDFAQQWSSFLAIRRCMGDVI